MNHRERVAAALRGEPIDRPPWSLWRHFYAAEGTAEQLTEQMLRWRHQYRFDFLKINPRAQYHVEPWGARYRYSGREHDRPERLDYPVKRLEDWQRLEPRGIDAPALAEQLAVVRGIAGELRGEVPFVQTVFTPLAVAGYMVEDNQTLVRHLRQQPETVHEGLETITRSFFPFAAACLEAGADGIFLATTRWASRNYLTPAEYAEFGRPYDLRILEAVKRADFNVLHVCDSHNMLLDLADYPVRAFNWAATDPTNPSIAEARSVPGLRIGGLSGDALVASEPAQVTREVEAARAEAISVKAKWSLGPSCSIPTTSRDENIRAAGRAIGLDL
jgi:uroporphyrinogen decarboxylase